MRSGLNKLLKKILIGQQPVLSMVQRPALLSGPTGAGPPIGQKQHFRKQILQYQIGYIDATG